MKREEQSGQQTTGQPRGRLSHAFVRVGQIQGQRLLNRLVVQIKGVVGQCFQRTPPHHRIKVFSEGQENGRKGLIRHAAERPRCRNLDVVPALPEPLEGLIPGTILVTATSRPTSFRAASA